MLGDVQDIATAKEWPSCQISRNLIARPELLTSQRLDSDEFWN